MRASSDIFQRLLRIKLCNVWVLERKKERKKERNKMSIF
jgi:hypothetical protein